MASKPSMSLTMTVLTGVGFVATVAALAVAGLAAWAWFGTDNEDVTFISILFDMVL